MTPNANVSASSVLYGLFSLISGHVYILVPDIYSVQLESSGLTNPQSAILTIQYSSSKIFSGFKSLCDYPCSLSHTRASMSCRMMILKVDSENLLVQYKQWNSSPLLAYSISRYGYCTAGSKPYWGSDRLENLLQENNVMRLSCKVASLIFVSQSNIFCSLVDILFQFFLNNLIATC